MVQIGLWAIMGLLAAGPGGTSRAVTVTPPPELPTEAPPEAPPTVLPETARPPRVAIPAGHPVWVWRPAASDISRVYPPRALLEAVEGRVIVECIADASGGMTSCRIVYESPDGYGFGPAALNVAMKIRLASQTTEGEPVEGVHFRVPFVFALAEEEAQEAPEPSGAPGP